MSFTKADLENAVKKSVAEVLANQKIMEERERANASSQPQETHSDHILNCPSCFKDFVEKLNKSSEFKCSNCGFPLGTRKLTEKLDDCPSCHGKDVEEIRK